MLGRVTYGLAPLDIKNKGADTIHIATDSKTKQDK